MVRIAQWAKYASTTPAWSVWPPFRRPAAAGPASAGPPYGLLLFDGASVLSGRQTDGDAFAVWISDTQVMLLPPSPSPLKPSAVPRGLQFLSVTVWAPPIPVEWAPWSPGPSAPHTEAARRRCRCVPTAAADGPEQ